MPSSWSSCNRKRSKMRFVAGEEGRKRDSKGTLRMAALFAPICIFEASISLLRESKSHQQQARTIVQMRYEAHAAAGQNNTRISTKDVHAISGMQGVGTAGVGPHEREGDFAVRSLLQAQLPLAAQHKISFLSQQTWYVERASTHSEPKSSNTFIYFTANPTQEAAHTC